MPYISKRVTTQGTLPLASNLYGTCSTAAGTATKEVSLSAFDVLVTGVTVHVKFTNGNTASSPKLKVGSTSAANIVSGGSNVGKWKSGDVVSFTYDGSSWVQNDAIGSQYGLSIDGRTVSLVENGGSSSITLPTGVTYSLTKSGNTITLSGSDGTSSSVTDSDTKYGLSYSNGTLSIVAGGTESSVSIPTYSSMTQTEASAGTSTTGRVISAKVLHDTIEELDDNTTYTISVSGHTLTLTPSSGTAQSVTLPDNDTKYGLSISGHTVSLVEGGTGTQVTVPDENTTYTIGVSGHTLTLTPSTGTGQSVTLPDTTYTLSISGDTLTLTPSSGTAQSVTIPSLKYTKDAPDNGRSLRNNVVQNDVTNNVANGGYSLAEGLRTTASGMYSHSEGWSTKSQATASHAEGYNTTAIGMYSHAEGWYSTSLDQSSHAEGYSSTASGGNSHAEGYSTEASDTAAHAEGYSTKATRYASHAEGSSTTASGQSSHSEGEYTTARSEASHAEGYRTEAIGRYSHSQNEYTIASGNQQTVIGKYNADDSITETFTGTGSQTVFVLQYDLRDYDGNIISITVDGQKASGWVVDGNEVEFDEAPADGAQISITYTLSNYAFIIGNGYSNNYRSNALAVKWDGTIEWKSEYDRSFGVGLTLDGNSEHTNVDIGWNYNNGDGAYLGLRSSDFPGGAGEFVLAARDTNNSSWLTGFPSGILTWHGSGLHLQDPRIDASKANNNVSTNVYPTTSSLFDSAGRIISRMEAVVWTNGDISANWYVRNYNTSGTQVGHKGIQMTMTKDGTFSYNVSDSVKFRNAIGINPVNIATITYTSTTTYSGVGNATLSVSGLYRIQASYSRAAVIALGYGTSSNTNPAATIVIGNCSSVANASIDTVVYIPAGTYKFWTKCASAGGTNGVNIIRLMEV